jgi:hypothetical protein
MLFITSFLIISLLYLTCRVIIIVSPKTVSLQPVENVVDIAKVDDITPQQQ